MSNGSISKIRFDSLCVAAMCAEVESWNGGQLQRMWQPNDDTLILGLYRQGKQGCLTVSIEPEYFRVHFLQDPPKKTRALTPIGRLFRTHLDSCILQAVQQIGFDRRMELVFSGPEGDRKLIIELMGKHCNLILVDRNATILACLRPIGASRSERPVAVGKRYDPPPGAKQPSLWKAESVDDLANREGASPLLKRYLAAKSLGSDFRQALSELQDLVTRRAFSPMAYGSAGAYPVDLQVLGLQGSASPSLSVAIETTLNQQANLDRLDAARRGLMQQLERAHLAREVTLRDLTAAVDSGKNAGAIQRLAELILAYQWQIEAGSSQFDTFDFEGNPVSIRLDPELDPKENANRYFERAKRAKSSLAQVEQQRDRYDQELAEIESVQRQVAEARDFLKLDELTELAKQRRWLHVQNYSAPGKPSESPFEGHRIRQLLGPNGFSILYGENASSNDYLTLRIGKPNDIWLHVRGSVSAHVIIQTHNQPQKVGPEVIRYAAEIAAKNSGSKHSAYVPVDYTLKKYVRKPKGGAVGTALYSHEKTIHVEPNL